MLTYEKICEVFSDLFEKDESIEVIKLKKGYYIVNWMPQIQGYDFGCLCKTLDELLDQIILYYVTFFDAYYKSSTNDGKDETQGYFKEIAEEKRNQCRQN